MSQIAAFLFALAILGPWLFVFGALGWIALDMAKSCDPVEPTNAGPPTPASDLVTCRACGDTYNRWWGSYCPNCSGAD